MSVGLNTLMLCENILWFSIIDESILHNVSQWFQQEHLNETLNVDENTSSHKPDIKQEVPW